MSDIKKWCAGQMAQARAALEGGLRQSDDEGMREEISHALQVYEKLEEELECVDGHEIEIEQAEQHNSARLVCDECYQRARNFSAMLTRLPKEEAKMVTLLQKLVAIEDQTVVRLRPYL